MKTHYDEILMKIRGCTINNSPAASALSGLLRKRFVVDPAGSTLVMNNARDAERRRVGRVVLHRPRTSIDRICMNTRGHGPLQILTIETWIMSMHLTYNYLTIIIVYISYRVNHSVAQNTY